MSRWDDFIKESPSQELRDKISRLAQTELAKNRELVQEKKDLSFWPQLLSGASLFAVLGIVIYFYRRNIKEGTEPSLSQVTSELSSESLLIATFPFDDELFVDNLEMFEELDLFEHLEEIEKWS